ncbi:MAG: excinuclease ABC subunit UvrC [candidate division WOR-3 bacterium]|nr:excinuclease ABC subunit UvrC [candidate division WOR-3 bacterium]
MESGIKNKINQAPSAPGVYIFKNEKNKPLYIGKAGNLKNRLCSYLKNPDPRIRSIIKNSADIDIIITNSDTEALTLEESLIKLHRPKYNIRLKDDKKFPYLKITVQEEYPRIIFTRNLKPDGAIIFGPYTSARALRQTRDALCKIFKIASCNKDFSRPLHRPCLSAFIGRCSAPCVRKITKEEYQFLVKKAVKFLKGESDELTRAIEEQMWDNAKKENFEAARILRDELFAIRRITQRQQIVTNDGVNRDVIGFARSGVHCIACLFRIRENRLISKEIYHLTTPKNENEENIISAFIRLIYTHISFLPEEIIVSKEPSDWEIQQKWFEEKGSAIRLVIPIKSELKNLLKWAERNAETELAGLVISKKTPTPLIELQNILQLENPPRLIEAFDISNLKEKFAVGASVAFLDGKPYKKLYRRYRIKRVSGQNDFAMIKEIVSRRLDDIKSANQLPDLLLIDGGKAQQNAALEALKQIDLPVPVFALAKRSDQLFYPDGRIVSIPSLSRSIILLKRIRDEAHRFAITYHRKVRSREIIASELDRIPGIGKKRKIILLKHFGSIEAIKKACEEDIAKVPSIGKKIARIIYESLHQ